MEFVIILWGRAKMKIKTIIILCILLLVVSITTATIITTIDIDLSAEDKTTLESVGAGIGSINKTRLICDNNSENCYNETYIDQLKLISISNDKFKLYEEGGINKEFTIKLERICTGMTMCIDEDMQEEYECCEGYRDETDEEVLVKAKVKAKEILDNIIRVTEERESRTQQKRFDDVEIIIN